MKIAIDISPLETGHKVRGVGFYLKHLKNALISYHPEHRYYYFTQKSEIPADADIVHYPYFEPFFITLPVFKKHKTIVTVHDLTPLVFPKHFPVGIRGNISWQIQKFNLKKSDAIITDSFSSQKDISKYAGIPATKIHTVYLAAGEEFRQTARFAARRANGPLRSEASNRQTEIIKKYNLPEKFVLYVGDVTWNKNLPRLIRAMKQINIPLVMVGKSIVQKDFDKTNVWNQDLVEVQKLTDGDSRFIKLGFIPTEDLVVIYNSAAVFIMPSIYEGFGLPIIEAMQSGCPVIAAEGGSLPEIAEDAAYYMDNYDTESIAKGIEKVISSKKLQEELSKKGLEQAKKFSWKKTAEKTIAVYKKVLDTKN
jgi:glycosyltransferase involved in cell wall biosynthesis